MPLFGQKPSKKPTHLYYATDLHGSERTFRKFINAGKFYGADVLIMGGDILGKLAIPIIREANGHYRATLQGRTEHFSGEADLRQLQERLGLLGFYFRVMDEGEFNAIQSDPAAVEIEFRRLSRQRLESWLELAETRLAGTGIRCYVTGGNDDYPDVLEALQMPGAQHIFGCEGEVLQIDDRHTLISVGFSTPTPWHTPREVSDDEL